jgi:hypothetical protein
MIGGAHHRSWRFDVGFARATLQRRYLPNPLISLDANWTCNLAITWNHLEASYVTDPKCLDALLLSLSMAVLLVYELGEHVLRDDRHLR